MISNNIIIFCCLLFSFCRSRQLDRPSLSTITMRGATRVLCIRIRNREDIKRVARVTPSMLSTVVESFVSRSSRGGFFVCGGAVAMQLNVDRSRYNSL